MALNIQRGMKWMPTKGLVYGLPGIGKSSLAAAFPSPVFLDTERGTSSLDVARIEIASWDELRQAIAELGSTRHEFKTVVIDSIDWAEEMLGQAICKEHSKASLQDFGYGKEAVYLREGIAKLTSACNGLIGAGMHVVFIAHAKIEKVSLPDLTDSYDRYTINLSKHVTPKVKEWCDVMLFCNYKTQTVEGKDKKTKAVGGKRRVMYAECSAAWDAKNRYGLESELPMTIESLAPIFAEPARRPGWRDRVAAATTLEELGKIGDDADVAVSDGKLSDELRAKLDDAIEARVSQIEGVVA
jgi:hypothetical protein